MLRHKSSGPKCEKIFRRISAGRSFSDIVLLAITDGSDHVLSPIWQQNWCYLHLIKYTFKNIEAQVDTSCINSNLDLELLGKSELTVQYNIAFNRVLSMPTSTKYSPFFSLQLQFVCLFYHALQCCNVNLIKESHSIKTCNKWVRRFYQPSHNFMYIKAQLFQYTVDKHPQSLSFP